MVYEVFVDPFPKIGHYVSVTRTGHRIGAASKREGWGGGYTSPSGCLPYLPPLSGICTILSLNLVSASVWGKFTGIAESDTVFVSPSCRRNRAASKEFPQLLSLGTSH